MASCSPTNRPAHSGGARCSSRQAGAPGFGAEEQDRPPRRAPLRQTLRCGLSRGGQLLLINHAVFHHQGDILQRADVSQGIARDGDDIGEVSRLEDADFCFPTEQFCTVQ